MPVLSTSGRFLRVCPLHAALLLPALALAACARDPASPVVPPPPVTVVLAPGTWVLTAAGGQPLPALVAHEDWGDGTHYQTFADSGVILVDADGRYTQRVWMRTVRSGDGALVGRPRLGDQGRVRSASDTVGTLESNYQAWRPVSTVRRLAPDQVRVVEYLWDGPDVLVVGDYRRR